jgi:hypothetical protein
MSELLEQLVKQPFGVEDVDEIMRELETESKPKPHSWNPSWTERLAANREASKARIHAALFKEGTVTAKKEAKKK